MNKSVFLLSIIGILALNSCTSLLDFQNARTIGVDNNDITASMSSTNVTNEEEHTTPLVAPAVDFTRGITEKLDLGITVQPFSAAGLHGKYQFAGTPDDKYAFSVMGELGYIYSIDDNTNADYPYNNLGLSEVYGEGTVLGSYYIGKEIALTSTLKYIYFGGSDAYTFANTYGFDVGKKIVFSFNVGYNFFWEDDYAQKGFLIGNWQYGLGVRKRFKFGANKEKEEKKTLN